MTKSEREAALGEVRDVRGGMSAYRRLLGRLPPLYPAATEAAKTIVDSLPLVEKLLRVGAGAGPIGKPEEREFRNRCETIARRHGLKREDWNRFGEVFFSFAFRWWPEDYGDLRTKDRRCARESPEDVERQKDSGLRP